MSRLLFVRHGKQQSTSERSELNRKDPPLSELGTRQAVARAEQLADELGGVAPLLVASSPMRRALMTAAPIAAALKSSLLVNGACYEYTCAGAEFRGSGMGAIRAISADATLLAVGPNGEWQYQGSDAEESDPEARQRARRVAEWLRDDCHPQARGGAVVLVAHQTFLDLVVQILLTGSDTRFSYGNPQHKLSHTGVCRLLAHDDGRFEKYQIS